MNDPKRIEELERRFDTFEDETNHNLTMLLGQAWKHGEQLRMIKTAMVERFDRLDDRVTEAHKEIAEHSQRFDKVEQRLDRIEATMATKEDISRLEARIDEQAQMLREILSRLAN